MRAQIETLLPAAKVSYTKFGERYCLSDKYVPGAAKNWTNKYDGAQICLLPQSLHDKCCNTPARPLARLSAPACGPGCPLNVNCGQCCCKTDRLPTPVSQHGFFSEGLPACAACLAGCKEEAELNNVLKSCIMVRRLKRQVLQQLPPKRRTQAR